MEISKELLSEVLGSPLSYLNISCDNKCEVRHSTMFENYQEGVAYTYLYGNQETRFMSKYELAFKLKEWLYSKDIMFDIKYHTNSNPRRITIMTYGKKSNFYIGDNKKDEVGALIKLGESTLKEINEK